MRPGKSVSNQAKAFARNVGFFGLFLKPQQDKTADAPFKANLLVFHVLALRVQSLHCTKFVFLQRRNKKSFGRQKTSATIAVCFGAKSAHLPYRKIVIISIGHFCSWAGLALEDIDN